MNNYKLDTTHELYKNFGKDKGVSVKFNNDNANAKIFYEYNKKVFESGNLGNLRGPTTGKLLGLQKKVTVKRNTNPINVSHLLILIRSQNFKQNKFNIEQNLVDEEPGVDLSVPIEDTGEEEKQDVPAQPVIPIAGNQASLITTKKQGLTQQKIPVGSTQINQNNKKVLSQIDELDELDDDKADLSIVDVTQNIGYEILSTEDKIKLLKKQTDDIKKKAFQTNLPPGRKAVITDADFEILSVYSHEVKRLSDNNETDTKLKQQISNLSNNVGILLNKVDQNGDGNNDDGSRSDDLSSETTIGVPQIGGGGGGAPPRIVNGILGRAPLDVDDPGDEGEVNVEVQVGQDQDKIQDTLVNPLPETTGLTGSTNQYKKPIHKDALALFFGSSSTPAWDKTLLMERATDKTFVTETNRGFIYGQSKMIVEKNGVNILVPALVYGLDADINLLVKENYEILQLYMSYTNNRKFSETTTSDDCCQTVSMQLKDLVDYRNNLTGISPQRATIPDPLDFADADILNKQQGNVKQLNPLTTGKLGKINIGKKKEPIKTDGIFREKRVYLNKDILNKLSQEESFMLKPGVVAKQDQAYWKGQKQFVNTEDYQNFQRLAFEGKQPRRIEVSGNPLPFQQALGVDVHLNQPMTLNIKKNDLRILC